MENSFNTSFIPKQSLQAGGETPYVKRRKVYGPGFFITVIIFALSVGISAALFFYTSSIERSIERKISQIEQTRKSLRPDVVAEISRMDSRLEAAKVLLSEHYLVTNALALLEDLTYLNVEYYRLNYVRPTPQEAAPVQQDAPQGSLQMPMISISGLARNLDTLALQVALYRSSEFLQDVELQTLDRDIEESPETGFQVVMKVDPRLLTTTNTALNVQSAPVTEEKSVTEGTSQAAVEGLMESAASQEVPANDNGQQPASGAAIQ